MPKDLDELIERVENMLAKSDEEVDRYDKSLDLIHRACDEVKKTIEKESVSQEQLVFSFMPRSIARISPFFPMNRRDLKNRQYQELTYESSWGAMTIRGVKLSMYDESVLLAILKLVMDNKQRTIKTEQYQLINLIGVKIPSKSSYKAVMESIRRLTSSTIELNIKDKMIMMNTILSGGKLEENGDILLTVNEYFLSMYAEGFITRINLTFRNSLKNDFAKSLYRFLTSHRGNEYTCHILTLARAVNIDLNMETWEIKKRIKNGLVELRKKGFLDRWMIKKNNMVFIWKKAEFSSLEMG